MTVPISPFMFLCAGIIGIVSAYFAHRMGRSPYLWFAIGFLFGIFGIFAIFFASKKKEESPKPEPVFIINGPKDKFWYYLNGANERQGPMSHDALTNAWKEGKIDSSTYVWHEELREWTPLKETLKLVPHNKSF